MSVVNRLATQVCIGLSEHMVTVRKPLLSEDDEAISA